MKFFYSLRCLLCLVLIALLFASCASGSKKVVVNDEYTALLYGYSAGGSVNETPANCYIGERFYKATNYEKQDMERKTVSLFGKDHYVLYLHTMHDKDQSYDIDLYMSVLETEHTIICYRSDTGSMVRFKMQPTYLNSFRSSVNCESTDEEYLAYANEILAEYANVSTEGWEAVIQRGVVKWQTEQGYFLATDDKTVSVSETEYEDLVDTVIQITYTKKIGEIKRSDKMQIKMTDAGEIISYRADNYEDAFAPFKDVQPDKKKILRAVGQVSSMAVSADSEILLTPHDGSLWAEVRVVHQSAPSVYDDTVVTSGVSYVVEIARLK